MLWSHVQTGKNWTVNALLASDWIWQTKLFSRTVGGSFRPSPNIRPQKQDAAVVVTYWIGSSSGLLLCRKYCTILYFQLTLGVRRHDSLFAVLGFLSTNAASQDIQLVVNSLNTAKAYAPTYKAAMSNRLNQIQSASLVSLDSSNINNRLVWQKLTRLSRRVFQSLLYGPRNMSFQIRQVKSKRYNLWYWRLESRI